MGGFSRGLICANSEQKSVQVENREDFDLILTGQLLIHQWHAT